MNTPELPSQPPSLTAIILTRNEAAHIAACIESVRWTDSVLVFDSFSSDDTVSIAQAHGAWVVRHRFENYAAQRDAAMQTASSPWVFFIDADERCTPDLTAEIRSAIQSLDMAGYWVPRHNMIFGRLTRGAGWYPDYQLRLLRRASARYDPAHPVHETVMLDGQAGYLTAPLVHHNYSNIRQFLEKQQRYTAYAAGQMHSQGVRVKPHNYILQPLRHFIWRFFTLKGYRDGLHGLRLSLLMAWYEYRKYVLLAGLWRAADKVYSGSRDD